MVNFTTKRIKITTGRGDKMPGSAEAVLTNTSEKLQEKMDQTGCHPNVFIIPEKTKFLNEFVLLFIENFEFIIDEYNLSKNDIRVIIKILKNMKFGNLISLSNSALATDLRMDKSNVSKILKKLRKTELIIDKDGSLFFNPHIAAKGSMKKRQEETRQLLDYSAMILEENDSKVTPSIGTDNIERMLKNKEERQKDETQKKIDEFYSNKKYLDKPRLEDFENA